MSGLFDNPVSVIIIAFIAIAFIRAFIYQWNVRRNGYEAEAVVDYISLETRSDSDGLTTYKSYHVSYQDRNGFRREGIIANPIVFPLEEGEIIIIRYVEDTPESPVYIRKA